MAHVRKYLIEFLNAQNDIFHVFISEKDYEGDIVNLRGATDKPFITNQQSGDGNVFNAIRAKEFTLNFVAENGISLLSFYSEDDERFRIDFYAHEVNGIVIDFLISSFYVLQDSCQQEFAAEPFEVTLKGTDNIALLKEIPFTTAGMDYDPGNGSPYLGDISLFDYFKLAIQQTGFADLPLRIYCNIFENTTDDRSDSSTADMFQEIFMSTAKYSGSDGNWDDFYTILEDILTTFNCCLSQENGAWNIFRPQEASLFIGNAIPGVEHNLTTGAKTAITLNYNWPVAFVPPTANFKDKIFFDKADQVSRIQRPYKFVKETFNFIQPETFIANSDLQLPEGAVPFFTETISGIRYDRYLLATYFPAWRQRDDDLSFLQTEFNISENRETDRYVVTQGIDGSHMYGIQFKAIPVTQNDKMSFSLQLKMLENSSETLRFFVKFILIRPDGQWYNLFATDVIFNGSLRWAGPNVSTTWDTNAGNYVELESSADKTNWTTYDLFSLVGVENDSEDYLRFPVDGMLIIQVLSTAPSSAAHLTVAWKDINFSIANYINDSTQVTGQFHKNDQNLPPDQQIKNTYDENISIDDSPRNTIAGTLFTDAVTNFDFDDTFQNTNTEIGDVHFTKTRLWHRSDIDEEKRLGEIIVYERMHQAFKARTIIEGTIYGLKNELDNDEWNFVSLLCILSVDSTPLMNFIFGVLEVDWMNATYRAVLNELYKTDVDNEPFDFDYFFQYIYKTD